MRLSPRSAARSRAPIAPIARTAPIAPTSSVVLSRLRRMRVALLTILAGIFACGSSTQTPSTPSPSSTKSDARCVVGMARHKPTSGWTHVGSIIVTIEDRSTKSFEIQDANGKVLESKPAPKGDPKKSLALVEEATCKLGGMLAALDSDLPNQEGTAVFLVLKPNAEDEKADVVMLCKLPEAMPDGIDGVQEMRLAFDLYEERLTTKKWRAWLKDLGEKSGALEGP